VDSRHLLREITAGSNNVTRVLLIHNHLCHQEFGILTAYGLEELFNLLTVGVTLIGIFVQRTIEALHHDFGAMLKVYAPLVTVVKCIQFGLHDGRPLIEFTLTMLSKCFVHFQLSRVVQSKPSSPGNL
jgi:hypothetical protein